MPLPTLPYATMTKADLIRAHNSLAATRGEKPIRQWRDSRCALIERVAILRTRREVVVPGAVKPPRRRARPIRKIRKQPITDAALALLGQIDFYEDRKTRKRISKRAAHARDPRTVISVGLSYPEVLQHVRAAFPASRTTTRDLWKLVWSSKDKSFPQKRPHGNAIHAQQKEFS